MGFVLSAGGHNMDDANKGQLTAVLPTGIIILTEAGVAVTNTAAAVLNPLLDGFFPSEDREASIVRCFLLLNLLEAALTNSALLDNDRRLISKMTTNLMSAF
jgi:hypothetical protein